MISTITLALLTFTPQTSEWYTLAGSDHWYSLTPARLSWPAADAEAQALGGHLAALTDALATASAGSATPMPSSESPSVARTTARAPASV